MSSATSVFSEQRIAVPGQAEPIRLGQFDPGIDQPELRIGRHHRPHAGVRRRLGLSRLDPGVVAELALFRHGVEDPLPLARPHVEAAQIAGAGRGGRRADDDGIRTTSGGA